MIKKIATLGALVALLYLPAAAYAQELRSVTSVEGLNLENTPNDTIVIISKEDTGVPGYFHEKYAFVDFDCPGGVEVVDYYGPAIDPKDPNLHVLEQGMCTSSRFDRVDGD